MKKSGFRGASWDSIFLTFVKLVTTLATIAQTKILSVGLSLTDYGTYSQANVVLSILTSLLLLGFGDAINYFYNSRAQQFDQNKRVCIVNTVFCTEVAAGILVFAFVMLGRDAISAYFSNAALRGLIALIAFKPMLDNLIYFNQILFLSSGKAKAVAIRNLIVCVLKLAAIYLSVHVFKSLKAIFAVLLLLDLIQLVFFKLFYARDGFLVNPLKGKGAFVRPILAYGLPMGIFALTNMLTRDIDKLVIGYMASTETLAVYANCSKTLPFDIVVASFATVLFPYIMKYVSMGDWTSSARLFSNYLKIGYYSVWMMAGAVLITSCQAVSFLYSDAYLPGNTVFILYIINSMLRFASMHLILAASGNTKKLMIYSLVSLLLNTVLNLVLYRLLGVTGPAIATLIVAVLYTFLILQKTIRVLKVRGRRRSTFATCSVLIGPGRDGRCVLCRQSADALRGHEQVCGDAPDNGGILPDQFRHPSQKDQKRSGIDQPTEALTAIAGSKRNRPLGRVSKKPKVYFRRLNLHIFVEKPRRSTTAPAFFASISKPILQNCII
jgi:O-antigen/teichoic acid export membrane protein